MFLGDLLYQITMFLIIVGVFYLVFRYFSNLPNHKDTEEVNQKLDKIIELLEENNKQK